MRVVFMGSPAFAVPSLELLLAREQVVAVVTQPDRPKGRGQALAPPPVKEVALRAGIPVLQPDRVRGNAPFEAELRQLAPDLAVVVAYGQILPKALLGLPRLGCVNVHASLLPKYRGAAPIVWAIAHGETETGVTIMQMDAGMDTGPILLERSCPIEVSESAGALAERLSRLGAEALAEALPGIAEGRLEPRPQEEARATYAPMLKKEQGRVDFDRPAEAVRDWIRAMDPWPGAYAMLEGQPLRLFRPVALDGSRSAPGTVLGSDRKGLWIACRTGLVAVGELQSPGRKRIAAASFLAGSPIPPGTRLE